MIEFGQKRGPGVRQRIRNMKENMKWSMTPQALGPMGFPIGERAHGLGERVDNAGRMLKCWKGNLWATKWKRCEGSPQC